MSTNRGVAFDRVLNRSLWVELLGLNHGEGLAHAFDEEDGQDTEVLTYTADGVTTVLFAGPANDAIPEFTVDNILRIVPGFEGTPLAQLPGVAAIIQQAKLARQGLQMATEALQAKGLAVTILAELTGDSDTEIDAFLRSGVPASQVKKWMLDAHHCAEDTPALFSHGRETGTGLSKRLTEWQQASAPTAESPA